MHRIWPVFFVLTVLCPLAGAAGQSGWTLTTGDLTSHPAVWVGLSDQGVQVTQANGPQTIPWARFVEIRRDADRPAETPSEGLYLNLTRGDRLLGQPDGMSGENLLWISPVLGKITLPLSRVASITRGEPGANESGSKADTDQAELANGDRVKGITTGLNSKTLTMQVNGQAANIPVSSLRRLQLAATGAASSSPEKGLRLSFEDGSILTVQDAKTTGDQLQLTLLDGSTRTVKPSTLIAIEQLSGPVAWLSSLKPAEAIQTPDFDLQWPARMNRSVTGGAIRFGSTTYDHGIGVHAYSKLRFNIPQGYRIFRTRYAIDGDGPLADVTVRIYRDEKKVYEQSNVRAQTLSPVVMLPLEKAKTLTLEVDFGQNGAVQDRFNWIEPALLKQGVLPATAPSAH